VKGDRDVVGPLAILSVLPIAYLNLPAIQSLMLGGSRDLVALIAVLGVGLLLSILNAQRLRAERRAEVVADELELVMDEQRTLEAITVKLATVADELQTSVERYRQQFGSLAAVFRARRDGRIVECSDLFARVLGAASPQQVLGSSLRDLFLDPAQWDALEAALARGAMLSNRELRWRRSDGTPLTVITNVRETDGFVEGVAIDITGRARTSDVEPPPAPLARVADTPPAPALDAGPSVIVVDLTPLGGRERQAATTRSR
jgi:PAS domain S-box-containing protein